MSNIKYNLDIIKRFEGFSYLSYFATPHEKEKGICTIGYGSTHINGNPVKMGQQITKEDASVCLENELYRIYGLIKNDIKVDLNNNQANAILSFVYNVGVSAFKKSTLLKKINSKCSQDEICNEFMRWDKQDGKVLPGLSNRRSAEASLYFSLDYKL